MPEPVEAGDEPDAGHSPTVSASFGAASSVAPIAVKKSCSAGPTVLPERALAQAVERDRADHHRDERDGAGHRVEARQPAERRAQADDAVARLPHADAREEVEVDRERLAAPRPRLDAPDRLGDQRDDGVADDGGGERARRVGPAADQLDPREEEADQRAGQRPSASGYGRRAPARRPTTAPVARPIARHGLNARKTSPKRIDANTRPTQNVIMMKVGAKLSAAEAGPDVAGRRSRRRAAPRRSRRRRSRPPGSRAAGRAPGSGRHDGCSSRGLRPHHRQRGERDDQHRRGAPREESPGRAGAAMRCTSPPCAEAVAGAASRASSGAM